MTMTDSNYVVQLPPSHIFGLTGMAIVTDTSLSPAYPRTYEYVVMEYMNDGHTIMNRSEMAIEMTNTPNQSQCWHATSLY